MAREREIEIEEFAKEIGRKWYNDGHERVAYASARQGALWADSNPSPKVLENGMKKLGLRTDKDGNLITKEEFADDLKNRDTIQRERLISNAVEWLKGHAYRYKEHADTPYNDLDLVRDFIVAMEEDK